MWSKVVHNIIVRALQERVPGLTESGSQAIFADWEMLPITRADHLVGVVLRKQAEVHIIIDPSHQNTICFIKRCYTLLAETIAKYGYAETKVARSHEVGHRLALLLGFSQVSSDDNVVHYKKV